MEAVRTSETSVNFNVTTQHNIPEDSKLHTRCRENLKCHKEFVCSAVSEGRYCNSCATCISHTISHGTTQLSIHLRLVQEMHLHHAQRANWDSCLCKCTLCARISCTSCKWIFIWVVPCEIVCKMHIA
jgi:hypothetical protein